ncbi:hypothetical protein CAOG_08461 [Capsaspora owczarzaki ATCC 30864]|uniref:hypothetical protein n=1 Tax=Capsaspora owczarzaki (strain ATCC 30864) TaxID=595528 RepID=UPI00035210ED|nr:hypothetical protein CAOG_08461 [Capsaspora owczarzaki ATCC 30864]|eukprot:XP_011270033.1 hypothetical protein CAOG_08461 [Capsaspora owczarzaki ATCC 30864]
MWSIPSIPLLPDALQRTFTDALQKRVLKFLLKRTVGQFLASELQLDQVDVQLGDGRVHLHNLALDVDSLNQQVADLPFRITHGSIGTIRASIPWKDIWRGSCELEFDNLRICLSPKTEQDFAAANDAKDVALALSMSTAQLATEFMKQEKGNLFPDAASPSAGNSSFRATSPTGAAAAASARSDSGGASSSTSSSNNKEMDGLYFLHGLIETVLAKIKVRLLRTEVVVEQRSTITNTLVSLSIRVNELSYSDVTPGLDDDSAENWNGKPSADTGSTSAATTATASSSGLPPTGTTGPFASSFAHGTQGTEALRTRFAGILTESIKNVRISGLSVHLDEAPLVPSAPASPLVPTGPLASLAKPVESRPFSSSAATMASSDMFSSAFAAGGEASIMGASSSIPLGDPDVATGAESVYHPAPLDFASLQTPLTPPFQTPDMFASAQEDFFPSSGAAPPDRPLLASATLSSGGRPSQKTASTAAASTPASPSSALRPGVKAPYATAIAVTDEQRPSWIKVRFRHAAGEQFAAASAPKGDIECFIHSFHVFLSPKQYHVVIAVVDSLMLAVNLQAQHAEEQRMVQLRTERAAFQSRGPEVASEPTTTTAANPSSTAPLRANFGASEFVEPQAQTLAQSDIYRIQSLLETHSRQKRRSMSKQERQQQKELTDSFLSESFTSSSSFLGPEAARERGASSDPDSLAKRPPKQKQKAARKAPKRDMTSSIADLHESIRMKDSALFAPAASSFSDAGASHYLPAASSFMHADDTDDTHDPMASLLGEMGMRPSHLLSSSSGGGGAAFGSGLVRGHSARQGIAAGSANYTPAGPFLEALDENAAELELVQNAASPRPLLEATAIHTDTDDDDDDDDDDDNDDAKDEDGDDGEDDTTSDRDGSDDDDDQFDDEDDTSSMQSSSFHPNAASTGSDVFYDLSEISLQPKTQPLADATNQPTRGTDSLFALKIEVRGGSCTLLFEEHEQMQQIRTKYFEFVVHRMRKHHLSNHLCADERFVNDLLSTTSCDHLQLVFSRLVLKMNQSAAGSKTDLTLGKLAVHEAHIKAPSASTAHPPSKSGLSKTTVLLFDADLTSPGQGKVTIDDMLGVRAATGSSPAATPSMQAAGAAFGGVFLPTADQHLLNLAHAFGHHRTSPASAPHVKFSIRPPSASSSFSSSAAAAAHDLHGQRHHDGDSSSSLDPAYTLSLQPCVIDLDLNLLNRLGMYFDVRMLLLALDAAIAEQAALNNIEASMPSTSTWASSTLPAGGRSARGQPADLGSNAHFGRTFTADHTLFNAGPPLSSGFSSVSASSNPLLSRYLAERARLGRSDTLQPNVEAGGSSQLAFALKCALLRVMLHFPVVDLTIPEKSSLAASVGSLIPDHKQDDDLDSSPPLQLPEYPACFFRGLLHPEVVAIDLISLAATIITVPTGDMTVAIHFEQLVGLIKLDASPLTNWIPFMNVLGASSAADSSEDAVRKVLDSPSLVVHMYPNIAASIEHEFHLSHSHPRHQSSHHRGSSLRDSFSGGRAGNRDKSGPDLGAAKATPFTSRYGDHGSQGNVLVAADDETQDEFERECIAESEYVIECIFPVVHLTLSKPMIDLLYVRFNDLAMWSPGPAFSLNTLLGQPKDEFAPANESEADSDSDDSLHNDPSLLSGRSRSASRAGSGRSSGRSSGYTSGSEGFNDDDDSDYEAAKRDFAPSHLDRLAHVATSASSSVRAVFETATKILADAGIQSGEGFSVRSSARSSRAGRASSRSHSRSGSRSASRARSSEFTTLPPLHRDPSSGDANKDGMFDEEDDDSKPRQPTFLSLSLTVGTGLIHLDEVQPLSTAAQNAAPRIGLRLEVTSLAMFHAEQYQGHTRKYMSIRSDDLALLQVVPGSHEVVAPILARSPVQPLSQPSNSRMVCVALRIDADLPQRVKHLTTCVDFRDMTWTHESTAGENWIFHLMELISFPDTVTPGYVPFSTMVRLGISAENLCVDYSPVYCAGRAVFHVGHVRVGSNIVPLSNSTVLSFGFREVSLFLVNNVRSLVLPLAIVRQGVRAAPRPNGSIPTALLDQSLAAMLTPSLRNFIDPAFVPEVPLPGADSAFEVPSAIPDAALTLDQLNTFRQRQAEQRTAFAQRRQQLVSLPVIVMSVPAYLTTAGFAKVVDADILDLTITTNSSGLGKAAAAALAAAVAAVPPHLYSHSSDSNARTIFMPPSVPAELISPSPAPPPSFQLEILNRRVTVSTCADSFVYLIELLRYYFDGVDLVDWSSVSLPTLRSKHRPATGAASTGVSASSDGGAASSTEPTQPAAGDTSDDTGDGDGDGLGAADAMPQQQQQQQQQAATESAPRDFVNLDGVHSPPVDKGPLHWYDIAARPVGPAPEGDQSAHIENELVSTLVDERELSAHGPRFTSAEEVSRAEKAAHRAKLLQQRAETRAVAVESDDDGEFAATAEGHSTGMDTRGQPMGGSFIEDLFVPAEHLRTDSSLSNLERKPSSAFIPIPSSSSTPSNIPPVSDALDHDESLFAFSGAYIERLGSEEGDSDDDEEELDQRLTTTNLPQTAAAAASSSSSRLTLDDGDLTTTPQTAKPSTLIARHGLIPSKSGAGTSAEQAAVARSSALDGHSQSRSSDPATQQVPMFRASERPSSASATATATRSSPGPAVAAASASSDSSSVDPPRPVLYDSGVGSSHADSLPRVIVYEPLNFVETHFSVTTDDMEQQSLKPPSHMPFSMERFIARDIALSWRMFGGRDFRPVAGTPAASDAGAQHASRNTDQAIEVVVDGLSFEFDSFPGLIPLASRLVVHVKDFEVRDRLQVSQTNKFLCYWRTKRRPRVTGSNMIELEMLSVRPDPQRSTEELRLDVKLLPLRINADQDAIMFLVNYFTPSASIGPSSVPTRPSATMIATATVSAAAATVATAAASTIATAATAATKLQANNPSAARAAPSLSAEQGAELHAASEEDAAVFIQHCVVHALRVRIDYQAKRMDLSRLRNGEYFQLLFLLSLEGAELYLNHLEVSGAQGFDRLLMHIGAGWLPHIKSTQLPSVLAGIPPFRSLANLSSGAADLIMLPIRHYRQGGRLTHGIQRGVNSFLTTAGLETLNLASQVAVAAQQGLEFVEDVLVPSQSPMTTTTATGTGIGTATADVQHDAAAASSSREPNPQVFLAHSNRTYHATSECFLLRRSEAVVPVGLTSALQLRFTPCESCKPPSALADRHFHPSKYADQPEGLQDGLRSAYSSLTRGLTETASTVSHFSHSEQTRAGGKTPTAYVRSAVRAVPVLVLRPMIGVTEAVAKTLKGARNELDPSARLDMQDKYKTNNESLL